MQARLHDHVRLSIALPLPFSAAPDVLIADYHLDSGDGVAAIRAVRERFGRSIAAILATANRSPEVRGEAERDDVVVMNRPLKPAPLRAQLTRYSAMREAAE